MKRPLQMMAGALAASLLSAAASAAETCALPEEKQALDTRALQTELMVAALTCGEKENYNQFVRKFQPALQQRGDDIRGYFNRVYKSAGANSLNKFVTRLANDVSSRSMTGRDQYCADARAMFSEVLAMDLPKLPEFVAQDKFAAVHGVASCGNGQQVARAGK